MGLDAAEAIVELVPRTGESTLRTEDSLETIHAQRDQIAEAMLGNSNYLTGQCFDVATITRAVWCSYKDLNSGPGTLAGCFVHERHHADRQIPRFEGWWEHDIAARRGA